MGRGRCKKPCPGCGEVDKYRSADKVCSDCHHLIKEALEAREHRKADKTMEARKLPFAAHGLPYIHYMKDGHFGDNYGRLVVNGLYELCKLFGEPAGGEAGYDTPPVIAAQESGYEWEIRRFPVGFSKVVEELYTNIVNGAEAGYRDGYRDGQNLLAGLAKGEVSIDKFNEVCAGLVRPREQKKLRRNGL